MFELSEYRVGLYVVQTVEIDNIGNKKLGFWVRMPAYTHSCLDGNLQYVWITYQLDDSV